MGKLSGADTVILVCEILMCIGLLGNAIRLQRRNKKQMEMVSLQKDRIREEKLDHMLQNQRHISQSSVGAVNSSPYDVVWHEEERAAYEQQQSYIQVQVEEQGQLSTRKYMLHVFDQEELGKGEGNRIIVNDRSLADRQLRLLRAGSRLFVQNLDTQTRVLLKRGKGSWQLGRDAVCVQSGDWLELGNTRLRINLL